MDAKIRWGIVGLGDVANRFASDLIHYATNAKLIAVASNTKIKANNFADKYGCIAKLNYSELAKDDNIDAVYIANINSLHYKTAALFIRNKKHILIEKPAVTSPEEWNELTKMAKDNNVLIMEAIKFIHFPAFKKLLKFLLQNPTINLTSIKAAFGTHQIYQPNITQPIFSKELLGGATNDVGVYPFWLYAFMNYFKSKKGRLWSLNTYSPQKSKVDETCDYTFEGEIMGFLEASISENLDKNAYLKGDQLEIIVKGKWWNPHQINILYKGKSIQINEPIIGGGFQYEAEHFGNLILNKKLESNLCPHAVSLQVIEWLDQINE